jgi:hypothetical protein
MNDEKLIWKRYMLLSESNNIDVEYLKSYEKGDEEKAQLLVDQVAESAGYDLSHRQKSENISDKHIVLFTLKNKYNFNNPWRNIHYGKHNFLLKSTDLPEVPDWVKEWASDHPVWGKWYSEESINPKDIVESAGAWDDENFVSQLWSDNENKFLDEGIYGFKTPDGAVVFDPSVAPIKSAKPFLHDNNGNLIPLSQRFV